MSRGACFWLLEPPLLDGAVVPVLEVLIDGVGFASVKKCLDSDLIGVIAAASSTCFPSFCSNNADFGGVTVCTSVVPPATRLPDLANSAFPPSCPFLVAEVVAPARVFRLSEELIPSFSWCRPRIGRLPWL